MSKIMEIVDGSLSIINDSLKVITTTNLNVYYGLFLALTAYCVVRYMNSPWRSVPPGPKGKIHTI